MGRARKTQWYIYRKIAVLHESYTGNYTIELRHIRWNKDELKYDIRAWSRLKGKETPCMYGFKFNREELIKLRDTLNAMTELNAPIEENSPPWDDVLALCGEKCRRKKRVCKK